jgi:Uncharacterised nucleotidyltransferase
VCIGAGGRSEPLPRLDSAELWPKVVELAIEHRVAPLLCEAVQQVPEWDTPAAARAALQVQLLRSGATRLLCESTLVDVIRTLQAQGLEIIVLKGPTVAHSVYRRPELRIYHDLDVLCRIDDYPALHRALSDRGYGNAGTLDAIGTHECLGEKPSASESHAVRSFYDPSGDVKIEVHFDVLQLGLIDRNAEAFWRQAVTLNVRGVEIRMLSPEHQFLHLAAHAHRHGYSRLSWLIELDQLMRRGRESLDWGLVADVARSEGFGTALRHALLTVHAALGAPLPTLPRATVEERLLALCYRLLWPFGRTAQLNQHERHRLLHFLPDDPDPRNVLYGLVLVGRRREKLRALRCRVGRAARRSPDR